MFLHVVPVFCCQLDQSIHPEFYPTANCLFLGPAVAEGQVHSKWQPKKTQVAQNMPGPTFKATRGGRCILVFFQTSHFGASRTVSENSIVYLFKKGLHHVYIMLYSCCIHLVNKQCPALGEDQGLNPSRFIEQY